MIERLLGCHAICTMCDKDLEVPAEAVGNPIKETVQFAKWTEEHRACGTAREEMMSKQSECRGQA